MLVVKTDDEPFAGSAPFVTPKIRSVSDRVPVNHAGLRDSCGTGNSGPTTVGYGRGFIQPTDPRKPSVSR